MFRMWLRRKVTCPSFVSPFFSPATPGRRRRRPALALEVLEDRLQPDGAAWLSYAHDPQHTAISNVISQPLNAIHWQTPVDLNPQYDGGDLAIHYGSPLVTSANTVIVPVKTGATDGFRVEGRHGNDGTLKWAQPTDYVLPPHDWTPSFSPTLTPSNRLYFPGSGGTIYYMGTPDADGATISGRLAFFGIDNYNANPAAYDAAVFINTPLTSDSSGNIYFGFQVTGSTPLNLQSGIARIAADGTGTWVAASTAAGDDSIRKVVQSCAPALSNDGTKLYVAVNDDGGGGYLLELDSTTLVRVAEVRLKDVLQPANDAGLSDDGSASPTVGPDGDVYFGVLENPFNSSKGWMLHFSGDLSVAKTPGAFGWDDTVSIVDRSLVPSYTGSSAYLLMTKYNNYAGLGGDGINKIAILDPNDTQTDPRTGATVMKEILTIAGVTPDPDFPDLPGAVREWCINNAVVDPFSKCILANSEDGRLYRWDLTTNTFTQAITLTAGIGEAYTPTLIGADGTVYAINNAILFAVGDTSPVTPDTPKPGVALARAADGRHLITQVTGDLRGVPSGGPLPAPLPQVTPDSPDNHSLPGVAVDPIVTTDNYLLRAVPTGGSFPAPLAQVTLDSPGNHWLPGVAVDPIVWTINYLDVDATTLGSPPQHRVRGATANDHAAAAGSEDDLLDLPRLSTEA